DDPNIALLAQYLNGPEARQKAEAYTLIWGTSIWEKLRSTFSSRPAERHLTQNDALTAVVTYLHAHKTRAVAIFHSMDEYQTGEPRSDRTVGALPRFAAQFNSTNDRIKIKLGLPAEIYPEIERASANPLKDFVNLDQVLWTAGELAQIAAYRYRL